MLFELLQSLKECGLEHVLEVVEHFVSRDTLTLRDPCPELVVGDLLLAKLYEEVLV